MSDLTIAGIAMRFNSKGQRFRDDDWLWCTTKPDAFNETLHDPDHDVVLYWEHDEDRGPLARTTANTLSISRIGNELRFEAELPDTDFGRHVYEAIRRGDMHHMSPGFHILAEDFDANDDGKVLWTIEKARLFEISIVCRPVHLNTHVEVGDLHPSRQEKTHKCEYPPSVASRQRQDRETLETMRQRFDPVEFRRAAAKLGWNRPPVTTSIACQSIRMPTISRDEAAELAQRRELALRRKRESEALAVTSRMELHRAYVNRMDREYADVERPLAC